LRTEKRASRKKTQPLRNYTCNTVQRDQGAKTIRTKNEDSSTGPIHSDTADSGSISAGGRASATPERTKKSAVHARAALNSLDATTRFTDMV
jgi:hypothetical protein